MSTNVPIASITLSSAAPSITFSSIPQTYTDLVCVVSATGDRASNVDSLAIRFNSDTGSNYSYTYMAGEVTTGAISGRASNQTNIWCGNFTSNSVNNPSSIIIQIQNYSNTTTNKTTLSRGNPIAGGGYSATNANVGLWRNTAAITSMTVRSETANNFSSGTTFNLYGIANASITNVAKATGGDSVTTDGTYWYHTFRSSGVFTPTQALTADYLVVAGGGAGGSSLAGGGGAGGMRCTVTATGGGGSLESALSLTTQAYTVTVGAGGAKSLGAGTSGSNSVFSTITSTGGGGGGGWSGSAYGNPITGGSGGGGAMGTGAQNTGANGTTNQGYAGGNGNDTPGLGGGGGGASAAGQTKTSSPAGAGGNGVATSISGTSVTYAGGGGGGAETQTAGAGGSGGGGAGTSGTGTATDGTANTGGAGGGGGSASSSTKGGNGGSGIVIIRYAVQGRGI